MGVTGLFAPCLLAGLWLQRHLQGERALLESCLGLLLCFGLWQLGQLLLQVWES